MSIALSIIIPSYQRRTELRRVLESLAGQSLAPGHFEVIVSLDGSDDGSGEMIDALETPYRLRWTNGPNAGAGVARNRGAALAEGNILLFLDDDILAGRELAANHLAGHPEENTVCLGRVQTVSDGPLSPWEAFLSNRYLEHYDKLANPSYQPDFWDCLSGNFSLSRSLWNQSGGFDETFRLSRHEDIELGYRLSVLGAHFCYRPDACGFHHFLRGLKAGLKDAYIDGLSAQRLANRYPELASQLASAHWQRCPRLLKPVITLGTTNPGIYKALCDLAAGLLAVAIRLRIPLATGRPIYRAAYHLQYWLGVRTEGAASPAPQPSRGVFSRATSR